MCSPDTIVILCTPTLQFNIGFRASSFDFFYPECTTFYQVFSGWFEVTRAILFLQSYLIAGLEYILSFHVSRRQALPEISIKHLRLAACSLHNNQIRLLYSVSCNSVYNFCFLFQQALFL